MNRPNFSLTSKTADPRQIAGGTVTLQSKVFEFHFPWGGFVWNRPVTVSFRRNGQVQEQPIGDPTLRLMLGLVAINFLAALFAITARSRRQEQRGEGAQT